MGQILADFCGEHGMGTRSKHGAQATEGCGWGDQHQAIEASAAGGIFQNATEMTCEQRLLELVPIRSGLYGMPSSRRVFAIASRSVASWPVAHQCLGWGMGRSEVTG